MAGSIISRYGVGDVNLTKLMATVDAQRKGYCGLHITNYSNSSLPAIREGSVIEVNGALYKFNIEEAISGSPSDGVVYIKVVPNGDSITAQFTAWQPTWVSEKNGWYDATGNQRYIPYVMYKSGTYYYDKRKYYFEVDGDSRNRINSSNIYTNGIAVTSVTGDTNDLEYNTFTLLKPCSCFLLWDQYQSGGSATGTDKRGILQINQYSTYRTLIEYDYQKWVSCVGPSGYGAMAYFGLMLNPGQYRIGVSGWYSLSSEIIRLYLYVTGIYGLSSLATRNIEDIVS